MIVLSARDLMLIMPSCPLETIVLMTHELARAMTDNEITSVTRAAAFIAQLAHESSELRHLEELASGQAYEGREDLGNTQPGDGPRFKGRGPIQITGRKNYRAAGEALGSPLVEHPELASTPAVGFRVAGWYWTDRHLNDRCDAFDFKGITRAINGAATDGPPSYHLRRVAYYQRGLEVLGRSARLT